MKKVSLLTLGLFLLTNSLFFVSCTKNYTTESSSPNINRTINYTVLVVAGESTSSIPGSSLKAAQATEGATSAVVQVSIQGKVISATTDISGQATFQGLTAGLAAVTVSLPKHTTVDFLVDLFNTDTIDYDNEQLRIASTKVVLFPTTDTTGMITVTGLVNVHSNITVTFDSWSVNSSNYTQAGYTTPGYATVPAGTVITATVDPSQFSNYVTQIKGGKVSNITYENVSFTATVNANGMYTLVVPSTAQGLTIDIYPNDFVTSLTYSTTSLDATGALVTDTKGNDVLSTVVLNRYIYSCSSSNVTAISGENIIKDIYYNNPIVTDPNYFGNSMYQPSTK
jgi:hypothetical protein